VSEALAIREVAAIELSKVEIPPDLDGATEWLVGTVAIQQLLLASEWAKAAIVRAFTEEAVQGHRPDKSHLTFGDFAELGIAGLKSKNSVARYYRAWEYARQYVPDLPIPEPGMIVPLPLHLKFPRIKPDPEPTPPLPEGSYSTIVADPPWAYDEGWPEYADRAGEHNPRRDLPYQSMTVDEICQLEIPAAGDAHLFLWTTNRYLEEAYAVVRAWSFEPSQVLVWCKPPRGIGPGGIFSNTAEFVLYGRRGSPEHIQRVDSTWWSWPRGRHSAKPAAFLDIVESICAGPYLEMFSREPRAGWESWGLEA
jgi:N6-adenosine-specific RNA methylase IME4